jgi:hypothetical protein
MVAEGTAALSSPFGYLLGPSWEVLGASWAPKWTPKSPPRAILDCVATFSPLFFSPGEPSGASWGVLGAS